MSARARDVLRYIDSVGNDALAAIGAIELALLAGADDRARLAVVREILRRSPKPWPGDPRSVTLLIEAIKASKAEFHLVDHEPAHTGAST